MIKEVIATGSTVDAAKEAALAELQAGEEEEIQFDILELPQKKTLGLFGGNPAKVRAYIEIPEKVETPVTKAADYLKSILVNMGLTDVNIEIKEDEGAAELYLTGEGLGLAIGHRGETLDALQYLSSLVANRGTEEFYRITVNTGDYREKRQKTLEELARRMAANAIRSRRSMTLEPMNPYERRIIHTTVQKIDGATSWSVGEGISRRVIIGTVKGDNRSSRPGGRGPRDRNDRFDRPPRRPGGHNNTGVRRPTRDGSKNSSRPAQSDSDQVPLYGKIEK